MKKKILLSLAFVLLMGGMVFVGADALAQQDPDPLGLGYGEATGLGNEDIRTTIAKIIQVALSLLGIIMVVIVIYAGFEWMTAGGNEEKVTTAKNRLGQAVIGLLIVLSAYAITNFVVTNLYEKTTGQAYQVPK